MTPEQVPDEQTLAVLAAWFDDGREEIADYDGEDVRAAQEVTVVIREQVAREIESRLCGMSTCSGHEPRREDVRIARGETS